MQQELQEERDQARHLDKSHAVDQIAELSDIKRGEQAARMR